MVKVSIVIPTYKREESLIRCLRSLLNQGDDDFEIIIVDQNEPCHKELAEFIRGHKDRIRYLFHAGPKAVSALNKGFENARGEIVIQVDDDVIAAPDFIKSHLDNYKDAAIGAVSGRALCRNDLPLEKIKEVGKLRKWDGKITANFNADFRCEVEHAYSCNTSFRREPLLKVGGYDERFKGTGSFDDLDLSFRIRKLGFKIVFDPRPEVKHLQDKGGSRAFSFREAMYWYYHNFMLFYLKNMARIFFPIFLARQIPGIFRRALFAKDSGAIVAGIKGLAHGVRDYRMKAGLKILNKAAIKRILVTRMQGLGDVVSFIPTLRGLRENFPSAEITMLAGRPSGREIIRSCPLVDKVIFYDIEKKRTYPEKFRLVTMLRKKKFDLVVASSQEIGFALKAFLSGARYRIGFKEYMINKVSSRDRFSFLNTVSIVSKEKEHDLEANLRLLEELGLKVKNKTLGIWIKPEDILFTKEIFDRCHFNGKLTIAVNPSSNRMVKNWPKERYAELLRHLIRKYSLTVILTGGQEAIDLNEEVSKLTGLELVNLAGKTTIGQLTALLSRCDLFIGNDSGPMNIAAALNIPVVALFGPGDETRFRPYSENSIVINKGVDCAPCNKEACHSMKCMELITVEEVIGAAEYFLNKILKEENR